MECVARRRPIRVFPVVLAAFVLALTGCAQGGSAAPTPPVTASPGGPDVLVTATPDPRDDSVPGDSDAEDPNVLGAPFAVWQSGGAQYSVTTFGSSSCLPEVTGVRVGAGNTVTLTTRESAQEVCTADFGPRTWTLDTPADIDPQSAVSIVILASTEDGQDARITLDPIA
ncbi:hypothetical protein [Klugiella xanthotipulae]|nr:hypothetical protein [Klugiella xanthotipulae]